MDQNRYHRQEIFYGIGEEGQKKLKEGKICIIGVGAQGGTVANALARAGVGYLRLIDRDIVEYANLQRSVLFTERDAEEQLPKAEAAKMHLDQVNSDIEIEAVIADVNPANVEKWISGVDLVVDGTDNLETKYLLNEACDKYGVRWIYGGGVGSAGTIMNIIPGKGPCLHCLLGEMAEEGTYGTCDTDGAVSQITSIIAAYQTTEAMKMLTGYEGLMTEAVSLDIWDSYTEFYEVDIDPDCPVCQKHEYSMLIDFRHMYSASLCGHDAYQVSPLDNSSFDYNAVKEALKKEGDVEDKRFFINFKNDKADLKLFPDGRAIINGVKNIEEAESIYNEMIHG